MATLREIRRRIRSVQNISQVTRAMQMVAASKMRRAQEQVLATRDYSEKAWELLVHVASRSAEDMQHPLLVPRPVQATGLVLITADRGLSGGYNHNIIRLALQFIRETQTPVKVIAVGRKGRDFMLRVGVEVVAEISDLPPRPGLLDVLPAAQVAIEDFETGISQIFLCIDPEIFRDRDLQEKLLNEIIDYTHDVEPMHPGDRTYYPGERSLHNRTRNLKEGIPVSEEVWQKIMKLAEDRS